MESAKHYQQMNFHFFVAIILSATFLLNKASAHAKKNLVGKNSIGVHGPFKGGSRNLRARPGDNLNVMPRASTEVKKKTRDLIIGGTEVQEGDYPYLAFLSITSSDGSRYCGGTLIEPNWILTAAHCADKTGRAGNITALLGVHNVSSLEEIFWEPGVEYHFISQEDIYIYPGYDSRKFDGDFALLYLSNGSNKTTPVLNHDIFMPAEKDTVWVSGWGYLYPDGIYPSDVPMEKNLEVVGSDACELAYADSFTNTITSDMLCATGWGEGSACSGDSGGPVVIKDPNGDPSKDVLVGVVSWVSITGCNHANRPDVFSRVSAALSWFLSMMPSAMELRVAEPATAPSWSNSASPTTSTSPMSL